MCKPQIFEIESRKTICQSLELLELFDNCFCLPVGVMLQGLVSYPFTKPWTVLEVNVKCGTFQELAVIPSSVDFH